MWKWVGVRQQWPGPSFVHVTRNFRTSSRTSICQLSSESRSTSSPSSSLNVICTVACNFSWGPPDELSWEKETKKIYSEQKWFCPAASQLGTPPSAVNPPPDILYSKNQPQGVAYNWVSAKNWPNGWLLIEGRCLYLGGGGSTTPSRLGESKDFEKFHPIWLSAKIHFKKC